MICSAVFRLPVSSKAKRYSSARVACGKSGVSKADRLFYCTPLPVDKPGRRVDSLAILPVSFQHPVDEYGEPKGHHPIVELSRGR